MQASDIMKGVLRDAFAWAGNVNAAAILRKISAPAWFRNAIALMPVTGEFCVTFENLSIFYVADKYDLIGRQIFWHGLASYEPEVLRLLYHRVGEDTLFIDVGANTGLHSLVSLACGAAKVVAMEPEPHNFRRLGINVARAEQGGRIVPCEIAASDAAGIVDFHVPQVPFYSTSASLNPSGFRNLPGDIIKVRQVSVDGLFRDLGVRTDNYSNIVVKIDVEGYENKVISGMKSLLRHPDVSVIFEAHEQAALDELERTFSGLNYDVFHLNELGPVRREPLQILPTDRKQWNYLAQNSPQLMRGCPGIEVRSKARDAL